MPLIEELKMLAKPIVDEKNAFIVDVAIRGNQGQKILELYVDTDAGVTTEQCAQISRSLSSALDTAELMRGRYHLVVSSPGIDRPLTSPRQYPRHVGRKITLRVKHNDQIVPMQGRLADVIPDGIILAASDSESQTIRFDEIIEAHIPPPW